MSACVSRRVQRAWRAVQVPAARSRQVEVEALRARFERRVILMPRDIIATHRRGAHEGAGRPLSCSTPRCSGMSR
jgi:hypothetical protein